MPDRDRDGARCLTVANLHAHYGESHVLHGINFFVNEGEVVSLLGRNGAGKTTTLKSIMGLVADRKGSIVFKNAELIGEQPEEIARRGIGYCPEDRGIFASLTVEENLVLAPVVQSGGMQTDEIFGMFPNIKQRLRTSGKQLSGGEQQMLAIARILRSGARMLLLDEPTEGLAPRLVQQIGRAVMELKARGFTILLIEQNLRFASKVSDWHYLVENGKVVDGISNAQALKQPTSLQKYLGI